MLRGKYQSLTLINWNGFFARTFDIDTLVTTLSGGNGAGKSTTMAAFITALIPDQTLLHFRNTTEAGSSQASRDKGLYGKLQPGACYAALDILNSQGRRALFVVSLQQVAGRDKKVEIKPFVIYDMPHGTKPTDVLVSSLSATQAKIRPFNELKAVVEQLPEASFKKCLSIVDYHSVMFDFGVVPKKLRNSSDRSKFYRLIEASLYGGISSAITRSLRDYLLSHNTGVKKAFQDMEVALKENRTTLEAIRSTQASRDLFKHLLKESTDYVAADYMRHRNERRDKLELALAIRESFVRSQEQWIEKRHQLEEFKATQQTLTEQKSQYEQAYVKTSEHLQLIETAFKQQEKIDRYQEDLLELAERLEEQLMVVEEGNERLLDTEAFVTQAEHEVDSLKTQLSDYQQALNTQQTRALQYKQAMESLAKAQTLLGDKKLTIKQVAQRLVELKNVEQMKTDELLSIKHQLDLSLSSEKYLAEALSLLNQLGEAITENDDCAERISAWSDRLNQAQSQLDSSPYWQSRHKEVLKNVALHKEAQQLLTQLTQISSVTLTATEQIDEQLLLFTEEAETLEALLESLKDKREKLRAEQQEWTDKIAQLQAIAPKWLVANNELQALRDQSTLPLIDNDDLLQYMSRLHEQEKILTSERDKLAIERESLDAQIHRIGQAEGSEDARLKDISEQLGGVLLSEIYDDIAIDDASYFTAVYGPSRHAIVLSDLSGIEDKLNELKECPEDLYLIEGDPEAFDDSGFVITEFDNAVCVKLNEQQLRYSRFPKAPLFGRAARELRLEQLRERRDTVVELHAKFAFDVQKNQRHYQSVNSFISSYLSVAFDENPEQKISVLRDKLSHLNRQKSVLDEEDKLLSAKWHRVKTSLSLLERLAKYNDGIFDDSLTEQLAEIEQQMLVLSDAKQLVLAHKDSISRLESIRGYLPRHSDDSESIKAKFETLNTDLKVIKTQLFALSDLEQRQHHLAYFDASELLLENSEMNQQLKQKLAQAEAHKVAEKDKLKQAQSAQAQANQLLVSLQSTHQAKADTLNEFKQELELLGVMPTEAIYQHAHQEKHKAYEGLQKLQSLKADNERHLVSTEMLITSLTKQVKKLHKEYLEQRLAIVLSKKNLCSVMKIARQNDVERYLHKRELAYMSSEQLRSMSDKSLGALRLAVVNEVELRDALRQSEDSAYPEKKVLFYILVYQHLRTRIRQDIIFTDDPVKAIEDMEIELARLTEELSHRESTLAMSSESVAVIINKTIQREQNRIRMLNQGLSNISFGQVNGVRLCVSVRETHQSLLNELAKKEGQAGDLFQNNRLTFSEAIAKLFLRINPQIESGQRSPQLLGEELLDYRNYLELTIEVNRGTDGWLQAESGALSTGEAIGTGQSILLMVVQSWEEESRRLRSKDILPCRLLFLDEAARLDARSISTLFELCERLDMQLLIAAPENISPERGTTYKLVRKIFKDHEHVHVVGLKGFLKGAVDKLTHSDID